MCSPPPADVLFGIEAPASPAHRPRFQQAFVFRGLVVLSGSLCQVPTLNPPGTYEISARLLPNPALYAEEEAGPEIQVVISDPSSSHARGQAQAAESLKPRKPQKPRIREIDETAAFQNRIPLTTKKAADENARPERRQPDPPSASKAISRISQKHLNLHPPPADVLFGIEAPASPAHRPRCQQAFVFFAGWRSCLGSCAKSQP